MGPHQMSDALQTIDHVRARLGRASNGRYTCPCCHAERSVSVGVGTDGKLLLHCFSGKNCKVWEHLRQGGAPARVKVDEVDDESPAQKEHRRLLRAQHILRAAVNANGGKPDVYLAARAITISSKFSLLMPPT